MEDIDLLVVETYLVHLTALQRTQGEFVRVAARYSEARGISRQAWLEFGVQPDVIDAALVTMHPEGALSAPA